MRTRFGLILKITARRKSSPFLLPYPHPYNAQPARCILKGLSPQEPIEIIQLIKYPPTLFNLSHFPKGCVPLFSPYFPERISKIMARTKSYISLKKRYVAKSPESQAKLPLFSGAHPNYFKRIFTKFYF